MDMTPAEAPEMVVEWISILSNGWARRVARQVRNFALDPENAFLLN